MLDAILDLCKASMESGTGVTLWAGPHSISMVVTKIDGIKHVEGHNQTYGKVVVLLPHVVAAAAG